MTLAVIQCAACDYFRVQQPNHATSGECPQCAIVKLRARIELHNARAILMSEVVAVSKLLRAGETERFSLDAIQEIYDLKFAKLMAHVETHK
jgi:hypothetical protein